MSAEVVHAVLGVVNWFDHLRGYGFIKVKNREHDVFVHVSDLPLGTYLQAGQQVEFLLKKDEKGAHAESVRVL